jgi:hypothetical protein
MRATRIVAIAAGMLAVGLIVIAFMVSRARTRVEAQVADATERHAKLRSELRRWQQASAEARPKVSTEAAPAPAPVKAATNPEPPLPPRTRPPGLMDFARDNPQLWNDFIQSKRVELGRRYLPLLQRLNLSSSQQERFKNIVAADVARGSDIGAAATAQGLEHTDPAIVTLREESERLRKRELAELFGPAGFREFEAYERALSVRGFVDGLATQLAGTAPLSAPQADQLERALAEASESYRNGKHADPQTLDWDRVDRRAREILTPEQFAAWQLGVAHNMSGGSRRAQELQAVYQRAVKRMKETAGVGGR